MIIHVVLPGETIDSIAEIYGVSAARLIQDNGLINPNNLVVGQNIVITYPEQTYTVQDGDTLNGIADTYGVTIMQLLRNNPHLSDREFIYPGEELVISYYNDKGKISTNGYAFPFIDKEVLKKTLPFLTYLSIFNYRATAEGYIIDIDDTEVIQIAKEYGVAPIMLLSTLSNQGEGSMEVVYSILSNQEIIDRQIDNILTILKAKGYYALNITIQYLSAENVQIYNNYILSVTTRLNNEGYPVFVTISPSTFFNVNQITFERVDYTDIGEIANYITLLAYDWGYSFGIPAASTSVFLISEFFDYVIKMIPPEKIFIGLSIIGYDWQLPYEIGRTKAISLNIEATIALANEVGAIIQYDEYSQAPFFEYVDNRLGIPIHHVVWFKNANSVNVLVNLVPTYGFEGVAIWNIMQFFPQMWLVINSQYEIEKVSPENLK